MLYEVITHRLTQATKDWNRAAMDSPEFAALEEKIMQMAAQVERYA